jgi:hypothetical protein
MDKFVVEGIAGFDGDYPCDIGSFTMRELQIIKRLAGVRAGELEEAFAAGDSDLILAIAVIAVRRNGKDWEQFEALAWETDIGALTFVGDEDEAVDPTTPTLTPSDSSTAPELASSGNGLSGDGEDHQETSLRAIGAQQSG